MNFFICVILVSVAFIGAEAHRCYKRYPHPSHPELPGANPCTDGPGFWCHSKENAARCKFDWTLCLTRYRNELPPKIAAENPFPLHVLKEAPCNKGPRFWCVDVGNAAQCNTKWSTCQTQYKQYISKFSDMSSMSRVSNSKPVPRRPMPGSNKCSRGPGFWCSSQANAQSCKFDWQLCLTRYRSSLPPKIAAENPFPLHVLKEAPCNKGPRFWCVDVGNAAQCNTKWSTCQTQYKQYISKFSDMSSMSRVSEPKPVPRRQKPGSDKCTRGPGFWCNSKANAKYCKFDWELCLTRYRSSLPPKIAAENPFPMSVLKKAPCNKGPRFWCVDVGNAAQCNTKWSTCQTKYKQYISKFSDMSSSRVAKPVRIPPRPLPGSDKCTRGPGFWCNSEANAKYCKFDWKLCLTRYRSSLPPKIAAENPFPLSVLKEAPCNEGPKFICATIGNAAQCNRDWSYCQANYKQYAITI